MSAETPVRPWYDADYVRSIFAYDPATGALWRTDRGPNIRPVTTRRRGYVMVKIKDRPVKAHRVIWVFVHGREPNGSLDHINGDRADNRLANLRDVSAAVNMQNQRLGHARGSTGLLGAHRCREKFRAQITVAGKDIYLGAFATAEEAHVAYVAAKRRIHEGCSI